MNLKEIKSIQLSLLKKETNVNENNQAEYTRKKTAKFVFPKNFFDNVDEEEMMKSLISSMFFDLKNDSPENIDSLAIWIEFNDNNIIENAISLRTLEDILEYSKEPIDPVYEFFKLTIS